MRKLGLGIGLLILVAVFVKMNWEEETLLKGVHEISQKSEHQKSTSTLDSEMPQRKANISIKDENKVTTIKKIKNYKEIFVEPEEETPIDRMTAYQNAKKRDIKAEEIIAKTDIYISKQHLVLRPQTLTQKEEQELQNFEEKIQTLTSQLQGLNDAI
jgi:hypothetical protein